MFPHIILSNLPTVKMLKCQPLRFLEVTGLEYLKVMFGGIWVVRWFSVLSFSLYCYAIKSLQIIGSKEVRQVEYRTGLICILEIRRSFEDLKKLAETSSFNFSLHLNHTEASFFINFICRNNKLSFPIEKLLLCALIKKF